MKKALLFVLLALSTRVQAISVNQALTQTATNQGNIQQGASIIYGLDTSVTPNAFRQVQTDSSGNMKVVSSGTPSGTQAVNVTQWNTTGLTATNPLPVSLTTGSYGAWTNGANLSNTVGVTLVGSLAYNSTNNTLNCQPYQGTTQVSSTNGNWFQLTDNTTGPANITASNGAYSGAKNAIDARCNIIGINGTALATSNALPVSGSVNIEGVKSTYFACVTALASVASATDIFTITGSSTTTIRITRIIVSASQATAALNRINLIKRSTADSGGTVFNAQMAAADSNNPAPGAVVKFYTANPSLGTQVGIIDSDLLNIQLTSGTNSDVYTKDFELRGEQAVVLRGTSQQLCVNLDGVTIGTSSFNVCITWTEEN